MTGWAEFPGGPPVLGLATAVLLATLVWVVSLVRRDVSVVDVFWGLGFVALAWTWQLVFHATHARAVLVLALVTLWGVRLAAHIGARNHGRGEDPRYAAMRARSPRTFAWTSLVTVFWLQAALQWVVALPILAALRRPEPVALGALDLAGTALWALGFGFQAVGDAQLAAFKRDLAHRGRVMDRGLWSWTRHPNYFGEACMWWGLALLALSVPGSAWALASPVLITFLLLRVSGVSLLEQYMASRPGWREYAARTSAFVPWPPRKTR
jgi:steroid 5-alpha reductase family enzyme